MNVVKYVLHEVGAHYVVKPKFPKVPRPKLSPTSIGWGRPQLLHSNMFERFKYLFITFTGIFGIDRTSKKTYESALYIHHEIRKKRPWDYLAHGQKCRYNPHKMIYLI